MVLHRILSFNSSKAHQARNVLIFVCLFVAFSGFFFLAIGVFWGVFWYLFFFQELFLVESPMFLDYYNPGSVRDLFIC